MPESVPPATFERYLGVDLHKDYVVVGAVNARLELVLSPRRVEMEVWPRWAKENLNAHDALIVESMSNAWGFCDQAAPAQLRKGCRVLCEIAFGPAHEKSRSSFTTGLG